jgi:hypothetical protein
MNTFNGTVGVVAYLGKNKKHADWLLFCWTKMAS